MKEANAFHMNTVMPLIGAGAKDTSDALANASKDPTAAGKITDGLINKYINPNKPEVAKAFLNTLDPTGRQAVEAQVVNKIVKGATSKAGEINYDSYLTGIKTVKDQLGSVFSSQTHQMLDGLSATINEGKKLNSLAKGISKSVAAQSVGVAGGVEAGIHGVPILAPAAILTGLHYLAQSVRGQQLLINVSKSPNVIQSAKSLLNGVMYHQMINAINQDVQPNQ